MSIAYVSGTIDADIEAVWFVLQDFPGIDRWVDRIRSAGSEDGTGPAAVGHLTGVFTRIYAGFLDDLRKHLAGA